MIKYRVQKSRKADASSRGSEKKLFFSKLAEHDGGCTNKKKMKNKKYKNVKYFHLLFRAGHRTNGTIKNDPIVPKKERTHERVLKIVGTICKGTERTFLKRSFKSGT